MLQEFFHVKSLSFMDKKEKGEPEKVVKPTVLVTDPKAIVQFICDKRGVSDVRLKLGLDGGRGFLKACLNAIDEQQTPT